MESNAVNAQLWSTHIIQTAHWEREAEVEGVLNNRKHALRKQWEKSNVCEKNICKERNLEVVEIR